MTGKILVIEDDREIGRMITTVLTRHGYTVYGAGDGREGMRIFGWFRPDLVITDVFMPEMDGIEVIRDIRRGPSDVKIIAISGGASMPAEDALRLAKRLGANSVMAKPFMAEHLLAMVMEALPLRRRAHG